MNMKILIEINPLITETKIEKKNYLRPTKNGGLILHK